MTDYNKTNVQVGDVVKSDVNTQLGLVETAVNSKLDKSGGTLTGDLDMNSNQILNLPAPTTASEPVRLGDLTFSVTLADAKYYDTVTEAKTDPSLKVGDVIIIKERASAIFDVIASTTNNEYDVIEGAASGTSLQLRVLDNISVKFFGATGDGVTDDTAAIQACFTYALANKSSAVIFPQGSYLVSSQLVNANSSFDNIVVQGYGAEILVDPTSSVFGYLFYFQSSTNTNFSFKGLSIKCRSKVATALRVVVTDGSSPNGLGLFGICDIDINVYDVFKDSTIIVAAHGVNVTGSFEAIYIKGVVDNVQRVNHASLGNECKGIAVSDAIGLVDITASVRNVLTPDGADADGIAVFGRDRGTASDPDDFIYKQGIARISGCSIIDCGVRHIKIQTSEATITDNNFIQEEIIMAASSSESINLQYGNGVVQGNNFIYRKTTSGAAVIGASHTVVNVANILVDEEMQSIVADNTVKTEVVLPRFINLDTRNAASATTIEESLLSVDNNKIMSILDLRGLDNITRAFIEFPMNDVVSNGKLTIEATNNTFSGASGSRLIGYTGYNGTDDLKALLSIRAENNENNGNANAHVFRSLSGSNLGLVEDVKFTNNAGLDHFFTGLNFDLNNLPAGTDFTYDISSSTVTNTPPSYPASGTAWIKTGNTSFQGTWFPQEMTLEDGTRLWKRVSPTWRTLI